MTDPLARAFDHASVSIVGICKNAGKTTVLLRLLRLAAARPRTVAVTSVGRDGEDVDIVTGTGKPLIWLRRGMLAATAEGLLRHSDITREIVSTTGIQTPLGEVVVFRALSDGVAQLAGPSQAAQLTGLTADFHAFGADIVLIDGALSRQSPAAPAVAEAVILCAGASYAADMARVVAHTRYLCQLLTLPQARPGDGETGACRHVLEGALTETALARLPLKARDEVIVRDGSRVLLPRAAFERLLARGVTLTARVPSRLCCVCVNPFSVTGAHFEKEAFVEAMARAVPVPVLNVKEADDDR